MPTTPDLVPNFARGTVTTAPSPATSGLSMKVKPDTGITFPTTGPFKLVVWPSEGGPTAANAEILHVASAAAPSGGNQTLTLDARNIGGTSARTVVVGDRVLIGWTKGDADALVTEQEGLRSLIESIGTGAPTGARIGFALNPNTISGAEIVGAAGVFNTNGDSWTPEYQLKMGTTYGGASPPGAANVSIFAGNVKAVKATAAVVGHTLIWHYPGEVPEWVKNWNPAGTQAEKEAALMVQVEKYVKRVVKASLEAAPLLDCWDVINEVCNDTGEQLRPSAESIWTKLFGGSQTIVKTNPVMVLYAKCFIWAHEVCVEMGRTVDLRYNEYDIETDYNYTGNEGGIFGQAKGKAALKVVAVLKELGAPITAVGIQGHRHVDQYPSQPDWENAFGRFQAEGVKVEVTEFDLNFRKENLQGRPEGTLTTQALGYEAMAKAAAAKEVGRITLWGLFDKQSWQNGREGEPAASTTTAGARPLAFDVNLAAKPAWTPLANIRATGSKAGSSVAAEALARKTKDEELEAADSNLEATIVSAQQTVEGQLNTLRSEVAALQSGTPPTIEKPADQTAKVGTAISTLSITATGSGLAWTATNLPPGLAINAGNGKVTGTPTAAGNYASTVTVTNTAGSAQTIINWAVALASPPESITAQVSADGTALESTSIPVGTQQIAVARSTLASGGETEYVIVAGGFARVEGTPSHPWLAMIAQKADGTPIGEYTSPRKQTTPKVSSSFFTIVHSPEDDQSTATLAAIALKPMLVRDEFALSGSAAGPKAKAEFYAAHGAILLPLAGFQAKQPSEAEAKKLKEWAEALAAFGIKYIEFGNETNYPGQLGVSKAGGETYGARAKVAADALGESGTGIRLLVQGSDAGSSNPEWLNGIFAKWASPKAHASFGGWTIHPYPIAIKGRTGNSDSWGKPMTERMVKRLEELGDTTSDIWGTEWGAASTAAGTAFSHGDNMNYAEAATLIKEHDLTLRAAAKGRLKALTIYNAHDLQAAGASANFESYQGAVLLNGQAKGAYTTAVANFFANG